MSFLSPKNMLWFIIVNISAFVMKGNTAYMKIQESNRAITIGIVNYEFPNAEPSKSDKVNFDANWLTLKVDYEEKDQIQSFLNPCMLTWELKELADSVSNILSGRWAKYVSNYVEPYIKIIISKEIEKYHFEILYARDTDSDDRWEVRDVAQLLSKEELSEIEKELLKYIEVFPER